jgi:hypothetical protein
LVSTARIETSRIIDGIVTRIRHRASADLAVEATRGWS